LPNDELYLVPKPKICGIKIAQNAAFCSVRHLEKLFLQTVSGQFDNAKHLLPAGEIQKK